jgi:chloride channel protein, CIC family
LGVFSGFISLYYTKIHHYINSVFARYKPNIYRRALIGGAIVGVLCLLFPALFGEGYYSIRILADANPNKLLDNSLFSFASSNEYSLIIFVGLIMLIKVIATTVTLSSGGNGGNFAPTLFVGAFTGFFFARTINFFKNNGLPESNFTLVGMAGILSGVMHAPLTGIFLIAELTGGYELIIPLMIVSTLSFLISRHFEPYSMDTKKLASKGLIFTSDRDTNILSQIKVDELIETDVRTIHPEDNLGQLIELVKDSHRNVFAVVSMSNELKGFITLDDIREIMFRRDLYETMKVKHIMKSAVAIIEITDDVKTILKKFDESDSWHLPVVFNKTYLGFISKKTIYFKYRQQLLEQHGING